MNTVKTNTHTVELQNNNNLDIEINLGGIKYRAVLFFSCVRVRPRAGESYALPARSGRTETS